MRVAARAIREHGATHVRLVKSENADLLTWCRQEERWLRETIERLVRLESPSTDKAAVDRCGAEVAARLEAIGGRVERLAQTERGDHVRARFDGTPRRILLLGHFDTVWPVGQIERMPVIEKDGKLYGPGVFDMKAGLAIAMLAVRAVREHRKASAPRIVMLCTTDEEIGSGTSRRIIEEEARRSDAVLVLEPSLAGAVKTSRKGCGDFELTVHGVSAHAGIDPGKGASAIHEMAHQIVAILELQDLARGVSVNVGLVSGGSRPNVVAERAQASIDVRVPTMADAERVEQGLKALRPRLSGTRLELSGGVERPPLERSADVVRLYEQARSVAATLGRELGEGSTGGGSDGNFTAAAGVPTLDGLGPRGDGAHALHEHVELEDLPWRAAFVAALLAHLGEVE
jgi:glutamate carboxypeptidase